MNSERGFTLLELLVAIAIAAALVAAAVEAHVQIVRSLRERAFERGRDVTALRVVDRLERELVSTLLLAKPEQAPREQHPWIFQGVDGGAAPGQIDSIRFITSNSGRGGTAPTGLRLVTYTGTRGAEERADLYRREDGLPGGLPRELPRPEGEPALRDVVQFQLRYQDPESRTWQDGWDSTQKDLLPAAVEITLELLELDATGETVRGSPLQRVVALPVKAIRAGRPGSKCATGLSVSECFGRIQPIIELLSAQDREFLGNLARAGADQCLEDQPTPEAVETLRTTLDDNGVSLAEVCAP
jgi:prepilin-type N-terminal cleavage/methylation domain-containing protein